MAKALPFFATSGQQIALHLPSFPAFPAAPGGASASEKVDVAQQSTLRSSRSGGHGRARRIGGPCAESRSGQAGDKTVCRKLRDLPSQPARARQRSLSPHALSLSAETLFQRFKFGLDAGVLSGIGRQRKARRGEIGCQNSPIAVTPAAAAGAGTGAVAQQSSLAHFCATKFPQACHLFDLCWPSILRVCVAGSDDDGGG